MQRYRGPALVEAPLDPGIPGADIWAISEGDGTRSLRLPWETEAEHAAALRSARTAGPPGPGRRGGPKRGPKRGRPGFAGWASRRADGTQLDRKALGYEDGLRRAGLEVMGHVLAQNSRTKYDPAMVHFTTCTVLHRARDSPGLSAPTGSRARQEEVQLLLEFIYDQGHPRLLRRRHTTVENKLFAIKWKHVMAGLPGPLRETPMLRAAIRGLRRMQGDRPPELPVTVEVLEFIHGVLDQNRTDHQVLWADLVTAFGFLLLIGENAADDRGRVREDHILT